METSGVRPGPEPFVRARIMHSSERTRVTRLFLVAVDGELESLPDRFGRRRWSQDQLAVSFSRRMAWYI